MAMLDTRDGSAAAAVAPSTRAAAIPDARVDAPPAVSPPDQVYTASLRFSPPAGQAGEPFEVDGAGYPANAEVELVWYTVEGFHELERGTEYVGQQYAERTGLLATVRADDAGRIRASLEVPLDFGGPHDVRGRVDGRELSQASLTIHPTITLTPSEGPVGTPVELRIDGVEWQPYLNTWHVLWDNRYLGSATGVTTRGVAVARFRATGPVGDHVVGAWNNSYNATPYLAWDTSPYKNIPGPGTELIFRTTADAGAPAAHVEDFSASDDPWSSARSGPAEITITPDRGVVGQTVTLRAAGLPGKSDVVLQWTTTVGNRITGRGFEEEHSVLATARTDCDGGFSLTFAIPDDLGGQHRIDVLVDGEKLGSAGLVILPSLVSFGPTRLRAGEKVRIHLKGLGWTTVDNTYTVTYDNAHIGYVCGFSTNGDMPFSLTATGAPGTHLIDLYPTIYTAKDRTRMPRGSFSVPQLTYAEDHPARRTPAVRLAIEIVE